MSSHNFRYRVGEIVNSLLILESFVKNGQKYYKYECQIDRYISEIRESHLYNGHGCPVCSNNKVLVGYNDMWATNPQLASMLYDKNDGYIYTENSIKKTDWICPHCKNIIKQKSINKVKIRGLSCEFCSDGNSYPNKFMNNLLKELKVAYIKEYSPKWADGKRYDFYIPSLKTIIEMDGGFHYRDNSYNGLTVEESNYIDKYKDYIAKQNGCDVIRINCDYNSIENRFDFISSNIKHSLKDIFDFSNVDFKKINKDSIESLFLKVLELYNSGYDIDYISNFTKMHFQTIRRYLLDGTKSGLCRFDIDKRQKPIRCSTTGHYFRSISLCDKMSQEIFKTKLTNKNMSRQIKLGKPHKGLLFEYVSKEQFNKAKQESPELCFGDSFVL